MTKKELSVEKLKSLIKKEIKERVKECWQYHKNELKDCGYGKDDIGDIGGDTREWEDIWFYEGVISGFYTILDLLEDNN